MEHYRNVGGFSEALSSHADEALAELKDEREKRIAERIFKRLTKREEGERDTRDPTTLRELVGITEAPVDEVIRVINVFSQPGRSFLTPHLESSPTPALDTIIDISHESLIRQWDTLKNWVIDEAKSADTYLRLEETARLYRAKNADPYRGLDLQGALQWRKTERPTDAWAKRYGAKGKETEAFEGAIAFLDESARNRDKEQASQERRWRITFFSVCAVMIGVYGCCVLCGVVVADRRSGTEQGRRLETGRRRSACREPAQQPVAIARPLGHRVHEALSVPTRQPKLAPRLGSYAAALDHDATPGFGFRRQLQPRRQDPRQREWGQHRAGVGSGHGERAAAPLA